MNQCCKCCFLNVWVVLLVLMLGETYGERVQETASPGQAVFNAGISALGRAAAWLKALLLRQTLQPSRYSCNAASSAAAAGSWPLALQLQLLGSCCALERDVVAWGTEVRSQERAGRWQHAVELLGEAEKFGVEMEIITCNTVLSSCQKEAEWQKCFDLVRLMCTLPRKYDTK